MWNSRSQSIVEGFLRTLRNRDREKLNLSFSHNCTGRKAVSRNIVSLNI